MKKINIQRSNEEIKEVKDYLIQTGYSDEEVDKIIKNDWIFDLVVSKINILKEATRRYSPELSDKSPAEIVVLSTGACRRTYM